MTTSMKPLSQNASFQEFDAWKTDLLNYLQNVPKFKEFLPDGIYESWQSLSESNSGYRINSLHADDMNNYPAQNWEKLLLIRNEQLSQMLKVIASFMNSDEYPAMYTHSTSFTLILQFISEFRNIDSKPKSIYKLNQLTYHDGDDFNEFYNKFRSSISLNLLKKGDKANNDILLEDEVISPTFDEVILIWSLEKINPNLPELVQVTFGDQLCNGTRLKDLQEDIFEFIPVLLEKIDNPVDIEKNYDTKKYETAIDSNFCDVKMEQIGDTHCEQKVDMYQEVSSFPIIGETYSIDENIRTDCTNTPVEENMDIDENIFVTCREEEVMNERIDQDSDNDPSWSETNDGDEIKEMMKCTLCDSRILRKGMRSHMKKVHGVNFYLKQSNLINKSSTEDKENEDQNCLYEDQSNRLNKDTIDSGKSVSLNDLLKCSLCNVATQRRSMRRHMDKVHAVNFNLWNNSIENDYYTSSHPEENIQRQKNRQSEVMRENCPICEHEMRRAAIKHHMLYSHNVEFSGKDMHELDNEKLIHNNRKDSSSEAKNKEDKGGCVCLKCGRTLMSKYCLKKHILTCGNKQKESGKEFFCHKCGKLLDERKQHNCEQKRTNKNVRCDLCRRTFFDEQHKEKHKCALNKCDQCDAEFIWKRNLERHKKGHEGIELFSCEVENCEGLFLTKRRLRHHHYDNHVEEKRVKKFSCDKCPMLFNKTSAKNHHMKKVHTDGRNFSCDECDKTFKTKYHLSTHINYTHKRIRNYPCSGCNTMFGSKKQKAHHLEFGKCKGGKVKVDEDKAAVCSILPPDNQMDKETKDQILVESADGILFQINP